MSKKDDIHEYTVFAATYDTVEEAERDYKTVKSLYYDDGIIDNFDAAVVQRRDNGKVKIVKKHEQPTRKGGWKGAGWGLATGFAIAIFPAAAIGSGLLTATTSAGAAIGALAGHAHGGMKRSDLKELGDFLDTGEAALIVVADRNLSKRLHEVMAEARGMVQMEVDADMDDLEQAIEEALAEEQTA